MPSSETPSHLWECLAQVTCYPGPSSTLMYPRTPVTKYPWRAARAKCTIAIIVVLVFWPRNKLKLFPRYRSFLMCACSNTWACGTDEARERRQGRLLLPELLRAGRGIKTTCSWGERFVIAFPGTEYLYYEILVLLISDVSGMIYLKFSDVHLWRALARLKFPISHNSDMTTTDSKKRILSLNQTRINEPFFTLRPLEWYI